MFVCTLLDHPYIYNDLTMLALHRDLAYRSHYTYSMKYCSYKFEIISIKHLLRVQQHDQVKESFLSCVKMWLMGE